MHRILAPMLAAALSTAPLAAEERTPDPPDPIEQALRQAALELVAARPDSAFAALQGIDVAAGADRDAALAVLVRAEAAILAGRDGDAAAALATLANVSEKKTRALAAAHALGLALASPAGAGEALAAALARWDGARDDCDEPERSLGDLAAYALAARAGDTTAAMRALPRIRKAPALGAALAIRGEAALERRDVREARERFEALAKSDAKTADGWLAGWGRAGVARARLVEGDTLAARTALLDIEQPAPLVGYARLLTAQLAWAAGDRDAADAALRDLDLGPWNPTLAAEARLLALQVALDRGDLGGAESLGVALTADLPRLESEAGSEPLSRALVLDLRSFHEALTRRTLTELADHDLLRRVPEPAGLASVERAVRLESDVAADAERDRIVLRHLLVHALEPVELESERAARRDAVAAFELEIRATTALGIARQRLAERQALLERGRAELRSTRAAIDSLAAATGRLHSGLAQHAARLAALEQAWVELLRMRLAALGHALAALDRGGVRLEARYPEGRSVRPREGSARARAGQAGERAWVTAFDSVHADVSSRFEQRLHDIFVRHEYAADTAKLDSLDAWVVALRTEADRLAQALEIAAAAERIAVRDAESALGVASAARLAADALAAQARDLSVAALRAAARARGAAYAEGARWGVATAAFHAALETPPDDSTRVVRLRHAGMELEAFIAQHPESPHAGEALYRLGECALQRATLEYQADLAAYLERGGDAADAPIPTEGYGDALVAYRRLLAEHPNSPRARDAEYEMGFVLAEMGSLEESGAHLERFLAAADTLDPRHGRAALRLGDDRLLLDDRAGALAAFRIAARAPDPETRVLGLFKQGWCAYDLDQHDEARGALRALLATAVADSIDARTARAGELAPEALELLALAFAADHDADGAARELDGWQRPEYDFALLRRIAALYASRALYDEAIATDELLLARHPEHPELPAVAEDLLHWIEVRHGVAAMHARAATLAPLFARSGNWASHRSDAGATDTALRPRWQSRLVEEDAAATRADSLAAALARPDAAAARMAERLRAAAAYEHRRAQADSTGGKEGLTRAAALYEQTLALFPGATDEPTTHLYLGEARLALGDPLRAADAYTAASSHPAADSTLAHTAAVQELVALDAAAGRDPNAALDRYTQQTEAFAARWPRDERPVEAWSRIGQLAFAAKRWDRASEAYVAVAEKSPDGKRAAAALKIVGDVEWQQSRFDAAAERYDAARARAHTAGADSLHATLVRLVPAALYRGAEEREKRGAKSDAAGAFERVAERHPTFEHAARSLYRAGGLRAADGDSAAAARDYERLVRDHPRSELVPDARLEVARCRESLGRVSEAALAYREFATREPQHPQARNARLRSGLLFARSNQPAAADSQYAIVLAEVDPGTGKPSDPALAADLWVKRARLATTPAHSAPHWRRALACGGALGKVERAEAHFQITESALPEYRSITLQQPISTSLGRKQKAVETLLAGYGESAKERVEPWHAAACLRLGETLADFGRALRQSEPPAELEGEDLFAYQESLSGQATTLEDRAVDAWSSGLAAARAAKHTDGWTKATEAKLWPMLATRVPTRPAPLFVLVQP